MNLFSSNVIVIVGMVLLLASELCSEVSSASFLRQQRYHQLHRGDAGGKPLLLGGIAFRNVCNKKAKLNKPLNSVLRNNDAVSNALEFVENEILSPEFTSDERRRILNEVDVQHNHDVSEARKLAVEDENNFLKTNCIAYENITIGNYQIGIRSKDAVLNDEERKTLIHSAEQFWSRSGGSKSRFTYSDNAEAHVADLSQDAVAIFNHMLRNRLYPLLREAFGWVGGSLCVYDSLVIRYNATKALEKGMRGAGQPLHRDLGIYSINIMMNHQENFQGGGTLFENQLRSKSKIDPIKPVGPGQLIAHPSQERHAGAATTKGTRDIMVIFIISVDPTLRPMRLRQTRDACKNMTAENALMCKMKRLYLALRQDPGDGEALQYMGTALLEYSEMVKESDDMLRRVLEKTLTFLEASTTISPHDSRGWNSFGLLTSRPILATSKNVLSPNICFGKAIEALESIQAAGCDAEEELQGYRLNLALYHANRDEFSQAVDVLGNMPAKLDQQSRVVQDAYRLYKFCHESMDKPTYQAL